MSFISSLKNTLGRRPVVGRATNVILGVFVLAGAVGAAAPVVNWATLEKDRWAPADYGYGPGKPAGVVPFARLGYVPAVPGTAMPQSGAKPPGAAPAAAVDVSGGTFGSAFPWPIIPIHLALLPDGRVLSYGTDTNGDQGALQNPLLAPNGSPALYDVWNPAAGTGKNAHMTLTSSNVTADVFCSAVSLLASGNALIVGGDLTVNGQRNHSNNKVEIFNPAQNTLSSSGQMAYARWYPSITTLPNGDKLVLGGTANAAVSSAVGVPTPELYSATSGWRTLTGISIDPSDWYYPRGFVGPDGAVYYVNNNGIISRLTTDLAGSMTDTGARMDASDATQPSVWTMDKNGNPFVALMARWGGGAGEVQAVDFSKNPPVVSRVGDMHYLRTTGSFTLLPNGQVFASGGSAQWNVLSTAVYQSELYNPSTQTWTLAASTTIPRLYHSNALLLPDGTVLTTGGGAPGPVNNLNGQIYYPPYLYRQDGSGLAATRPTIVSAPQTLTLNQTFQLTVGANDQVGTISLIRAGNPTHNYNSEQRLVPVTFQQNGTQIIASLSASPSLAPPGYYMLFVLNKAGVPAIAKIVSIGAGGGNLPDLTPTSLSYDPTKGLFTVGVSNVGNAATPSGVVIGAAFYVDGIQVTWGAVPGPLAAGSSINIDSSGGGVYTISPGTHTISVWVDDVNRMAESNKSNNQLSVTVTIGGSGNLPDLTPTTLSYSKATGLFTVGVSNIGTAATPSGVVIGSAFYVDGVNVTWGATPGPLAAGSSVNINSSGGGAFSIPSGTHTISVWVDDVNRMAESNKSNNKLSQSITVP